MHRRKQTAKISCALYGRRPFSRSQLFPYEHAVAPLGSALHIHTLSKEKTEVLAHKMKKTKNKKQSSTFIHSCGLRSRTEDFICGAKKNCGKMIGAEHRRASDKRSGISTTLENVFLCLLIFPDKFCGQTLCISDAVTFFCREKAKEREKKKHFSFSSLN